MAVRLPKLEKELADVKTQLASAKSNSDNEKAGLIESLDSRNQQISELEQNYSEISKKLTTSQSEIRNLRARIDTQKEDLTDEVLHVWWWRCWRWSHIWSTSATLNSTS